MNDLFEDIFHPKGFLIDPVQAKNFIQLVMANLFQPP